MQLIGWLTRHACLVAILVEAFLHHMIGWNEHVATLQLEALETLQMYGSLFGLAQPGALDTLEVLQRLLLVMDLLLFARHVAAHTSRIH